MLRPADNGILVTNRKATFNYHILERLEAGLVLLGTEVKAIRAGGLNFRDAHVEVRGEELFLVGCHVAPYTHGNRLNHDPERARKLLLHKREIRKLAGKVVERGLTLVPLSARLRGSHIKVEIGLGRGKRAHDKREAIRKRDVERDTQQVLRDRSRA